MFSAFHGIKSLKLRWIEKIIAECFLLLRDPSLGQLLSTKMNFLRFFGFMSQITSRSLVALNSPCKLLAREPPIKYRQPSASKAAPTLKIALRISLFASPTSS